MALSIISAEMKLVMGKRFLRVVFSNGETFNPVYSSEGASKFEAKYGIPLPHQPILPPAVLVSSSPPESSPTLHAAGTALHQHVFSNGFRTLDGNHSPQLTYNGGSTLPAYHFSPNRSNPTNSSRRDTFEAHVHQERRLSISDNEMHQITPAHQHPKMESHDLPPSTGALHHANIPAHQGTPLPTIDDKLWAGFNEMCIEQGDGGVNVDGKDQIPAPALTATDIAALDAMILSTFSTAQLENTYTTRELSEAFTPAQFRDKFSRESRN